VPSDPPDVFHVDLDTPLAPAAPGAQHVALWLEGNDLFAVRVAALRAIDARLAVDPHATLDVVLAPRREFPLDLLDRLRARLDSAPSSYASRALGWRCEDLQRRIAVVLRGEASPGWIDAVRDLAPVFRDQRMASALRDAERLGGDLPELVEKAVFGAAGRQVERPLEADVLGNGRVDEGVERALPERLEHLDDVLRARADVAVDEAIGVPRHGHLALLLRGSDRRGLPCRAGESNRYPRASP